MNTSGADTDDCNTVCGRDHGARRGCDELRQLELTNQNCHILFKKTSLIISSDGKMVRKQKRFATACGDVN